MPWAIKCHSENRLDGKLEYFVGCYGIQPPAPLYVSGYKTALFKTRKDARKYIKAKYGYIASRPDLRREPHGWRMPIPVKVEVMIREIGI
jgi:hypothetical protein